MITREQYQREYSGGYNRAQGGLQIVVPDDVERVAEHEPCGYCGQARGPCRHRRWAA